MITRTKVTGSSGNIFADIGLPNAENHALKAEIVLTLAKMIERSELSQSKAAAIIGIAQPDLSKLLRGNFTGFSLERLFQAIMALGNDVEIRFKKAASKRRGHGKVLQTA